MGANTTKNLFNISFIKKHRITSIIFAYLFSGVVYGLTTYVYNYIIGKEKVLSILISIPLEAVFWPLTVYADLKHIGVLPQDVLALTSAILSLMLIIKNWRKTS